MRRVLIVFILVIVVFTLSSCSTDDDLVIDVIQEELNQIDDDISIHSDSDYGSVGALDKTTFSLEEMLYYALQDEYSAKTEYEYIMEKFDVTKPFSNIRESEITHIALLLPLFDLYDIALIEDTSIEHLVEIESLQDAYEIGVVAEINNIAMYNLFLEQEDLPEDIVEVFIELRDASINHLQAFEKNAGK